MLNLVVDTQKRIYIQVALNKLEEVNTVREMYSAEIIIKSRWISVSVSISIFHHSQSCYSITSNCHQHYVRTIPYSDSQAYHHMHSFLHTIHHCVSL